MTRKLECRQCGAYNNSGTPCRCQKPMPEGKDNRFMAAIEGEINKAVGLIESGNEYEGLLSLKGIQLAFRLKRAHEDETS